MEHIFPGLLTPFPFTREVASYSCLLDGTGEPNTWNQFAGLRTGYWFPRRVCTGKIALFNSPRGWVSSHTPLSQADWVRHMDSSCFFRGVEKMSERSDCYLELKDCMWFWKLSAQLREFFFFSKNVLYLRGGHWERNFPCILPSTKKTMEVIGQQPK